MTKFDFILGAFIAVIVAFVVFQFVHSAQMFKGVPAAETTSNASTTVNATNVVTIANENSQAAVRCFSNTGTGTLSLWFSATSTGFTSGAGISVFTLTTFCSLEPNVWAGKVFGLMSNGTTTVTYAQY